MVVAVGRGGAVVVAEMVDWEEEAAAMRSSSNLPSRTVILSLIEPIIVLMREI